VLRLLGSGNFGADKTVSTSEAWIEFGWSIGFRVIWSGYVSVDEVFWDQSHRAVMLAKSR
jgi:hypothetical protein